MTSSSPSDRALVAAFLAALPDGEPREAPASWRPALLALWREACAARPALAAQAGAFARALARSVDPQAIASSFARLHVAELSLACAAGQGDLEAISIIDRELLPKVRPTLARARFSASEIDDVLAILMERLLVAAEGPEGQPPLIAQYRGRGELVCWLRISALRLARRRFRGGPEIPLADQLLASLAPLDGSPDPELEYFKRRYAQDFDQAFCEAVAAAPRRARTLLRLHWLDGLTLDRLSAIYHVPRSTLARQLASARQALLDDVERRLRSRLGVDTAELHSILRLVASRIELAMAHVEPG
jgi:RNA polymerase sigma-70 factor (ECF subfamily)